MTKGVKIHNILLYSILITVSCLFFYPKTAFSQFYNGSQVSFGKNRVQHQSFNWQYMRADQYDVYFYPTGKALAQYTFYKIPDYIAEIEQLLNYTSRKKIQFIVYNTQADFRESNFAYDNDDFYNQGGVTNIYGTKVYLYFDGNREHFDKMIRGGIMNIYAHWLVEGATMSSNISTSYLIDVPNWFYSGLSSYFGQHWSSDVDAHVKDGILSKSYGDFEELSPVEATYAGHSFWKYIVDTYGERTIPKILYSARSTKSIERGFYFGTGTPYRELLVNWFKHYYIQFYPDKSKTLQDDNELLQHPKKKRDYNQLCVSPDGEMYAYVTNDAGQFRVWIQQGDKKRCIMKRYQKTEDNPDLSYPLICWHPQGEILGLTLEDKGHCYYYPYNLERKKWEKRFLVDVEKITSWCYSNDGKLMLFSGFQNGQSDIFIYSFLSRSFENITKDFYDDYDPIFLNNKQIVFASNRSRDTISLKEDFQDATPQSQYDLFLYEYGKKDPALLRVTNTPYANEYGLQRIGKQELLYLNDSYSTANRSIAVFDSTIGRIDTAIHYIYYAKTHPLTDGAYSIFEQCYDPNSNTVTDIILKDNIKHLFNSPLDLSQNPELNPSVFHNKIQRELIKQTDSEANVDSIKRGEKSGVVRHGFSLVYAKDKSSENAVDDEDTTSTGNKKPRFHIPVASGYRVQYSINQLVTQADFSFLNTSYQQFEGGTNPIYLNTGFNALFMVGINDLFEDHRITGGFRLALDLESNEFMFSYEDLSRRLDRQIVLYRQSLSSSEGSTVYRQTANSIFYILKYPFNKTNSLRLSLKGRYETNIVRALSDNTLTAPNAKHLWAGVKLEYVFDSSKELYTNLWKGTKMKLFAEYEQRAERETKNLFVVGLDVRHSFKLYKSMTFAVRAAASTNIGSARLVYYMGGVDNWIAAKFNSDIWVDQSKDYAYQTLATNMRGFQQNIRNGTSFALASAELRVPFVQLIAGHKVSFNFLNTLQLNLFGDIGTAWTGLTPYSYDNCLYTRYIYSGPITVMVKRQTDPFVGGFGAGLRCSIFGYFLRFDYAWGVEDFKITNKRGMFTFSIGTDF